MSDTPDHPSDQPPKENSSDSPAARLSRLWRQRQVPDLRAFLAGCGRLSAAELTDVLCTDQRERWLHGQHPSIEAYLHVHGSLHPGSEPAIDLILGEFLVRRQLGESPTPDEYCRRFPDLAEQLRLHVCLYDALGEIEEDPSKASRVAEPPSVGNAWSESAAAPGPDAGAFESDYQSFQRLLQDMAQERSAATLLTLIVRRLARAPPRRPGTDLAGSTGRPVCNLPRAP